MSDDIKGPAPGLPTATSIPGISDAIVENIARAAMIAHEATAVTPEELREALMEQLDELSDRMVKAVAAREDIEYRADIRAALQGMMANPNCLNSASKLVACAIQAADEIRRQLAARKGAK